MLTYLILPAAVALIGFIVVVALRPSDFKVERSTTVNASAAAVYAHVNDLHQWEQWSPWAKVDPKAKTHYDGSPAGVGAGFGWSGSAKLGQGHMTIIETRPDERVRIRLDFIKPFKGTNIAEFTFKSSGGQTAITWSMTGHNNFFFKAFGLFIDCEKMCGDQFEKGLADLKRIVDVSPKSAVA